MLLFGSIVAKRVSLWYSGHMDLAKKLGKYADKHAFFYVTLDPERATGLEDIMPNYMIICPYASGLTKKLQKNGVNIVVLEENMSAKKVKKAVARGTYGMLQNKFVQVLINKTCTNLTSAHIMVLKNSELIEGLCKKQGWRLLAPKASIAEKFENKISQYKLLKNTLPYPKSSLITPEKFEFHEPVVLQFNRGHSGNSTFFIESQKDIENLYKLFPKREARVSEYIKGKTYTLNCLLLNSGDVLTGSLSEQITGLRIATNNPHTTVGNDFASPGTLYMAQVRGIQKIALNSGHVMHKKGYRGLFGIDVIIEEDSGKIYFIELNTHQPASVSFEAKLHRNIGKTPLLAYFILDNLGKAKPVKKDLPPLILPTKAKQIIYRNKTNKTLTNTEARKKYKNKGLMSRMKLINPNEEVYRRQTIS